jgi:hypothetical protein
VCYLNKGILPSSRGELIAQNVDFIVLQSLFDGFQVRHTYKVAPMMGIDDNKNVDIYTSISFLSLLFFLVNKSFRKLFDGF